MGLFTFFPHFFNVFTNKHASFIIRISDNVMKGLRLCFNIVLSLIV